MHEEPSSLSLRGARAPAIDDHVPAGPPDAFLVGREFAYLHPAPDRSLHMTLPGGVAKRAVDAGWAQPHPAIGAGQAPATAVMIYAPRTPDEIDVVLALARPIPPTSRHIRGTQPNKENPMTPQDMDKIVGQHLTAEAAGDIAGTVAMYTDDIEHDVVGWPTGPGRGIPAARDFYTHLTRDIHTEQMTATHSYYGEDFCVIEHQWTGTVPGAFLGIPGHGRRISFRLLHVWEFRDGQMSRENVWLDGGSIVAQLTGA